MHTRLRYRRDGQTDGQTDRQTAFQLYIVEKKRRLYISSGALAISINLNCRKLAVASCCEKGNTKDEDVDMLMVNILPLTIT